MRIIGSVYEMTNIMELSAGDVFVFESEAYVKTIGSSFPRAVRCLTGCLCTFSEDTMVEHKPNATLFIDGVAK